MQKGIELASRDFKKEMVELINGSGLPPILVGYILRDVIGSVDGVSGKMLEEEERKYEEELKKEKGGKEKKEVCQK